jgi:hypothetical protein
LLISTCLGQSHMLKEDFSQHGVLLVLSDDPTYRSELEKLGPSVVSRADVQGPGAVLVKNTSQQAVVALGVRFTKRSPSGHFATSDVLESQPWALLDRGQPGRYDKPLAGLVLPGAARLVTPDGLVDPLAKASAHYWTALPWTIVKVQLDSVIFCDGEAIGLDQLGLINALKAHVDAQQDLMEQISARLSHGEALRNVLEQIRGELPPKTENTTLRQTGQIYSAVRRQYVDELTATAAGAGDEAAIRRLKQLTYSSRPNIHREKGGY